MLRLTRVETSYEVFLPYTDMKDLRDAEESLAPGGSLTDRLERLNGVEEAVSNFDASAVYFAITADEDNETLHDAITALILDHIKNCREFLRPVASVQGKRQRRK